MSSPRVTAEERKAAARRLYETAPGMTAKRLAGALGLSPETVAGWIHSEQWTPREGAENGLGALAENFARGTHHPPTGELVGASEADPGQQLVEVDPDSQARAAVVRAHQQEWKAVRAQVYGAARAKDSEAMRRARTMAEALKIMQDGERAAYGITAKDTGTPFMIDRE